MISLPPRVWVQTGITQCQVSTYADNPSTVHDNGKPWIPYVPESRVQELEYAIATMALPYEALRMDEASRKWISPVVWKHIVEATDRARTLLGITTR